MVIFVTVLLPIAIGCMLILFKAHIVRRLFAHLLSSQSNGKSSVLSPEAEPEPEPEPEPSTLRVDPERWSGTSTMYDSEEVNAALDGYLNAVGIAFALFVAQLYQSCARREELLRELISTEAGMLHQAFLLNRALREFGEDSDSPDLRLDTGMSRVIFESCMQYARSVHDGFVVEKEHGMSKEHVKMVREDETRLLYQAISAAASVRARAKDDGSKALADRLMDTFQGLLNLRYRRFGESQARVVSLPIGLVLAVLSSCLFFGVLMLHSGSQALDLTMCALTVMVIVIMLFTLLDMDSPFSQGGMGVEIRFEDISALPSWTFHSNSGSRRRAARKALGVTIGPGARRLRAAARGTSIWRRGLSALTAPAAAKMPADSPGIAPAGTQMALASAHLPDDASASAHARACAPSPRSAAVDAPAPTPLPADSTRTMNAAGAVVHAPAPSCEVESKGPKVHADVPDGAAAVACELSQRSRESHDDSGQTQSEASRSSSEVMKDIRAWRSRTAQAPHATAPSTTTTDLNPTSPMLQA